jgi:glycosyltransferase involved in cell wall biosynthesis
MDLSKLPAAPSGKRGWPWTAHNLPPLSDPLDGNRWPLISIVTPSRNQGRFIEETIRSVLLQGYPNLEYIVIDGGSTDESVELIKKYSPWITYWVSERDRGQSHAINKGFARARGGVIGWLNSDDVLMENALLRVGRYFSEHPSCEFLGGYSEFRDVAGESVAWSVTDLPRSLPELLEYSLGRYLAQPSVFFTRRVFDVVGPLREQLHYTMDLDLWLRLSDHCQLYIIPEALSWMRAHDDAKTFRDNVKVFMEAERITDAYRLRVPPSKYRAIVKATRQAKARACIRLGYNGDSLSWKRMVRAIFEVLRHDRSAVFTREGFGLALRLVIPAPLWKLLFG